MRLSWESDLGPGTISTSSLRCGRALPGGNPGKARPLETLIGPHVVAHQDFLVAQVQPAVGDHGLGPTLGSNRGQTERTVQLIALRAGFDQGHDAVLVAEVQLAISIGDCGRTGSGAALVAAPCRPAASHVQTDREPIWLVDLTSLEARGLTEEIVNGVYGSEIAWTPDREIVFKAINPNRGQMPQAPDAPAGPVIQETTGEAAPSRTYQDLLTNPYEEAVFSYFMDSQLHKVDIEGNLTPIGKQGLIKSMSLSPDGNYFLVEMIKKPFSYLVPAYRFPYTVEVWDHHGTAIKTVADIPLDEVRPLGFGAAVTGPRSISWRADHPSMLYWTEAQDGGDPKVETDVRDIVFTLEVPFDREKEKLAELQYRFSGIDWSDGDFALLTERWPASRQEKVSLIRPGDPADSGKVVITRSYDDIYNDPGNPVMTKNELGKSVILRDGNKVFMTSEGGSSDGSMPFLSTFDVQNLKEDILWRSQAPFYERVIKVLDEKATQFITLKEGTDLPPNYWLVNTRRRIAPMQVTDFKHPYASIKGINKELVKYKRNDGLDLSAIIYTPEGFDPNTDQPIPVLMWAYPREYKSSAVASQVRGSRYRFIRLSWGSPIYWVTQGYAIMDQTEMPIVGEGDDEPNDEFVSQLVANAAAAIDYIVERGIGDRERIAVGGHSYGAFMTANLLSHSDLFAAGLARSGAYNRTLTPFGFQYEQRTYWQAPEVYNTMSPFMNAHKVKAPILLTHGQADNNSGTFPIQSERYYNALKGHGAITRLVFLPHESHGYSARESVLHTLYEQHEWLEKWVKNKQKNDILPSGKVDIRGN